ncbi:MAG: hypothetical protein IPK59_17365 [Rhodospirillaceae bacterium]|nr:hypothetical protein [Rhodospirillaceae bacterium]
MGRPERIAEVIKSQSLHDADGLEVVTAANTPHRQHYHDMLYERLQRKGILSRDVQRMVNQDRNVFAACMVAAGHADAMVTGVTRSFNVCLDDAMRVIDPRPGQTLMGLTILVAGGRTVLLADTNVHELPSAEQLADFAVQTAAIARQLGHEPRIALLSFSNFGNPPREKAVRIREAVLVLDQRRVDFEYEGEMQANVALNYGLMKELYPFTRLSGPANILIMPALHSANIAAKLMQELGGTSFGPVLVGLSKSVQIVQTGATVNELVTAAAFASLATTPLSTLR